jgi:Fe-S-cluster-containing hydrogenase component 2
MPDDTQGWGIENLPYPEGTAYISTRWDLCIGCGGCEVACAMFHFGTINRHLSRIRIFRYLLPLPKSVQAVCCQCPERERECQKACPVDPPVIYYDEAVQHMAVDEGRCLGESCAMCRDACPAAIPGFYPEQQDCAMVCDLCETDVERIHPDEKAGGMAKRLYPLAQDRVLQLPEEVWGPKGDGGDG